MKDEILTNLKYIMEDQVMIGINKNISDRTLFGCERVREKINEKYIQLSVERYKMRSNK